jgi:hypothetical protein
MTQNKTSPVGWYVGAYLLRFIELDAEDNFDEEKRFLSWENTVLVRADSLDEAYEHVERIALANTEPYCGGLEGRQVKWVYEGITELLPIYEELEHGSEIMYAESTRKLKSLRRLVKSKEDFAQ